MGCASSKDYGDQSSGDSAHVHTIAPTAEDAARRVRPHRRAARCPASARSSLDRPATSTAAPAGDGRAAELGAVPHRRASGGGLDTAAAAAAVRPASSAPVNTTQEKRAREALRRRVQRDLQYGGVQMSRMLRDHFGGSAEDSPRAIPA